MQIWNHSLIFFPFFSPLCIAVLPPFILGRATHPLVNMSPTPPLAFFFGFTCSCSIFLLTRLTVARLPMPIHTELVFFFSTSSARCGVIGRSFQGPNFVFLYKFWKVLNFCLPLLVCQDCTQLILSLPASSRRTSCHVKGDVTI